MSDLSRGRLLRRWASRFHRYVANPITRRAARFLPGLAVIETTGRISGRPRHTPIGGRLVGASFWLVSDHGRHSAYVRNIIADPRVRLQLRGRWHSGTAQLLDDDDARRRLSLLPGANSALVRLLGTDLLTVRIDFDDAGPAGNSRREAG